MPLNSIQNFVATQLNGLAMPLGMGNLVATVAPPVVQDLAATPLVFCWGGKLSEKRQTMAGPSAATINTTGAFRDLTWSVDIYIKYAMSPDDPNLQAAFPLVVDYVMQKLRSIAVTQVITDATTGWQSQIVDIGGEMQVHYGNIHSLADQRFWLFEAELICTVRELVQQ